MLRSRLETFLSFSDLELPDLSLCPEPGPLLHAVMRVTRLKANNIFFMNSRYANAMPFIKRQYLLTQEDN